MKPSRSRRLLTGALVGAMVAALLLPGSSLAGSAQLPAKQVQMVFVELTAQPSGDPSVSDNRAQAALVAKEQAEFRKAAKEAGVKLTERFTYGKLFNGFSLVVKAADLPKLARLPGVQNIYPVVPLALPELHTSTDMIRAPEVVADGIDGTGVKVTVIDTGIDYSHPDLGGCLGVGCRVAKGYDFVGDNYMGPGDPVVPDNDPMDLNGHGTHVAGIIGARAASDAGVTGVAPGVTLFAYKVFGPDGPTSADIMVAAMEAAYEDGADVVNMSIGSAFQWPRYPTGVAADRLVQRGVVVSVSAGNSGTAGMFAGGAPSVGARVLAVASFDNTSVTVSAADLSDGSTAGYSGLTFSPAPAYGQSFEVVPIPNLGNADSDYNGLNVTGKVVLVSRGVEPFANKVARAMRFGAAGAIVHNNSAGFFFGTLGTATNGDTPWIPSVSMSQEDGARIRSLAASGPVHITFTEDPLQVGNPTGGQISSFSSWGPSPDLDLKPDLGAPGGFIYSTYPQAMGGYASLSGTSMAAPHVAGAAALMIQANPRMRSQQIQDVLRNTAVPRPYQTTPYLWPINRQGAGMIDVRAAISTPVRISPAKLSLGEYETGTAKLAGVQLTNTTNRAVTYTVSHQPALTAFVDYPNSATVRLSTATATVTLDTTSVTVPARGSVNVNFSIAPPGGGAHGLIFGGYIAFTANGQPTLRLPYLGYQGDYQAEGTLDYSAYGLPWLARLEGDSYYRMENMSINPLVGDNAYVLFNLGRQASKLKLSARATRGRNANKVYDLKWVGRNSDPNAFSVLAWDGRDAKGNLMPQGDYVLVLEVLRPMGDEGNPDHWDTWMSGPVTVRYR